jgi:hypothetical protein
VLDPAGNFGDGLRLYLVPSAFVLPLDAALVSSDGSLVVTSGKLVPTVLRRLIKIRN